MSTNAHDRGCFCGRACCPIPIIGMMSEPGLFHSRENLLNKVGQLVAIVQKYECGSRDTESGQSFDFRARDFVLVDAVLVFCRAKYSSAAGSAISTA